MPTYQSVTPEDRIEVAPHLGRARDSLRAAEALRDAGLAADAVTRAHQACVHAERALLATEKRSPPDARSVHRLAVNHFLQPARLPATHAAEIDRLALLRARADDEALARVGAEDAERAAAAAEAFVRDVEEFLRRQGHATP